MWNIYVYMAHMFYTRKFLVWGDHTCLCSSSQLEHGPAVRDFDITMTITCVSIVFSIVWSGADQRKHESSVLLAFVRRIHRWPVDSPHKGPVTRKMFPFADAVITRVAACQQWLLLYQQLGFSTLRSRQNVWMKTCAFPTRTTRMPTFWDTPAAPWLPKLMIHIRSHIITRQSQSYKLKKNAKN